MFNTLFEQHFIEFVTIISTAKQNIYEISESKWLGSQLDLLCILIPN